jgi:hypothetical protein
MARMKLKKIFVFLGAATLVAGGHLVYLYNHREFGPKDFSHPHALGEAPSPDEQLKNQAAAVLQQRFSYLGCGTQVTAYESADHRYVIKFFNPRNTIKESWFHKTSRLCKMSSLKWMVKTYGGKKERLRQFFERYRLAFQDLRDEAGLVYVHLDQSTALSQKLEVVDKEGRTHQVDLNVCPFVLQKKVELTLTHLDKLLEKEDIEGAQEGVRQIYALFLSRAQKGYTDKLQILDKNYGFAEGRAVQLDVGRICKKPLNPAAEMKRIVENIGPNLPSSLAPVLQECLEKTQKETL